MVPALMEAPNAQDDGQGPLEDVLAALETEVAPTSVDLGTAHIGPSGAGALASALIASPSVTSLSLNWNNLCAEGAAHIATVLAHPACSIKSLDLNENYLGPRGMEYISEALRTNISVTSVEVRGNGIRAEGAASIAAVLTSSSVLRHLDLRGNRIEAHGSALVANAMRTNRSLESLDLRGNGIGDAGVMFLTAEILNACSLSKLDLSRNDISDDGATHLAAVLKSNSNLTSLDLSENFITLSGTKCLIDALETNTSLTEFDFIDLGATSWLEEAAATRRLADALAKNRAGIRLFTVRCVHTALSGCIVSISCTSFAGDEVACVELALTQSVEELYEAVVLELARQTPKFLGHVRLVLLDGTLLHRSRGSAILTDVFPNMVFTV